MRLAEDCKDVRRILPVFLFLPLLCQAQQQSIDIVLPVKQVHEECLDMQAGQSLHYRFESSADLEFNLHFHHGNNVTYPDKGKYSNYSNSYVADQANTFCLMWENTGAAPAKLQSAFRLESARAN